jgi:CRP-like cAMP-binding protein
MPSARSRKTLQATSCNAIHSIEQRTARWIISTMDRTRQDLVPLTHGQLAAMLGVARSYTSRVLQAFKSRGRVGYPAWWHYGA